MSHLHNSHPRHGPDIKHTTTAPQGGTKAHGMCNATPGLRATWCVQMLDIVPPTDEDVPPRQYGEAATSKVGDRPRHAGRAGAKSSMATRWAGSRILMACTAHSHEDCEESLM